MKGKWRKVLIIMLVFSIMLLSACGGNSTDSGEEVSAEGNNVAAEGNSETAKAELGTRENPIPIGQKANIGSNWEITVLEIVPDAWSIIEAENMFNEPPQDGYQYVMANIQVSYVGEESGTPWVDLSIQYLGSDGNVYSQSAAVVPNAFIDIGEQFPGATAEGNISWAIPAAAVSGGRIMVEESFNFEDTRVFFEGVQ
ncbi:MAG: hypothetical protein GX080_04065 [Tissierellia bacterium]|nr:hypothetical protein [Tissierellia bacterium]